ncbi:MAG: biotin/lipoyl-binding protein [Lachnospiraceae bacterium]|nr:biotin/lipoyl-binding protein [Lachnospiraceae bacterium]
MKNKGMVRHAAGIIAAVAFTAAALGGCGRGKDRPSIKIATENVFDKYDLALAQIRDVELIKTISCTYSQLKEEKLSFTISGLKVAHVYVEEGQDVKAGDLIAELDVSSREKSVFDMQSTIREKELDIQQQNEMIAYYESRIASPSVSLAAKEEYVLSKEKCEENIIASKKRIEYCKNQIEKDEYVIENACIYAGMDGTVLSLREGIEDWTSNSASTAATIVDTSVCAFKATDPDAIEYLSIGDRAEVEMSNGSVYQVTVTSLDSETGKIVLELDEPDFSLAMGASGKVKLLLDSREQVLALPSLTVYNTDEYYYVFTLSESGVRELQKVEVGLIGNDYVEIKSGVELNSSVILR